MNIIVTRIKPKGLFKWFKNDGMIIEYPHMIITGEWDNLIIETMLRIGDRFQYREI